MSSEPAKDLLNVSMIRRRGDMDIVSTRFPSLDCDHWSPIFAKFSRRYLVATPIVS